MPSRIFFGYRAPAAGGGSGATQLTLANAYASFVFDPDSGSGFKLSSFQRIGGHSFTNSETALWSAAVYDTTTAPTTTTSTITPTDATFTAPSIAIDSQGQYISCVWTSVPVGADRLNVTVTLRLNDTEDFLRVRVTSSWASAATYALHSLSVLSLSIPPYHQGFDYAALPFGFGVLSEDPVQNLRYSNGVPGFPTAGFGRLTTNTWTYPAGRGWAMGVWGYYETQSSEAWMVYVEDWSLEPFQATFEGDGSELAWNMEQEQPNSVVIGNSSSSLGSAYTFCLRPFAITQAHGWVDIGQHYKERMDSQRPSFWVPVRPERTDYSTAERAHTPFLDFTFQASGATLSPGNLATMISSILVNSGMPSGIKPAGIVEESYYALGNVGETPTSDIQSQLAGLYTSNSAYLGAFQPADYPDNSGGLGGEIGPNVWDIHRWHGATVGDQSELRWWTNNDMVGGMRMSRRGYLEGGGTDRLAESFGSPGTNDYYRERNYLISAWTGPTLIATVAGTPTMDGFTGTVYADLIPVSGAARLARSFVTLMGASTIKLYTGFFDALGATAIPAPGDSIEVFTDFGDPTDQCFHAAAHSSYYMTRLKNNFTLGQWHSAKACGCFVDVFSDPNFQKQSTRFGFCYRDHSAWSKIDAGYVNHPLGGGAWYKDSIREYARVLKQSVKDAQISSSTTPFCWLTCEDIDETCMDRFDWCWHTVGAGGLWRIVTGFSPTVHKYKTIPLYAVAHAGKTMGRSLLQELASAILEPSFPYNDPDLRLFLAYCLAVEWPYGLTWPTLSFYTDNTVPMHDFWDNTKYASAGGAVSDTVRLIRDLWTQIAVAEADWLLDAGFRYGEFMAPGGVDYSNTDTTTGLAQTFWASTFYHAYDTIYERATYPRVVHGVWKASDGSVIVVLANWTDTTARWQATFDFTTCGFASDARIRYRLVDYLNQTIEPSVTHEGATFALGVNEVPAFTIRVFVVDEEPTLPPTGFRGVMIRSRW